MPAKFHPVAPAVWDRTMRELSGPATVARLYVLTCPTRLSEGLFHLPVGHLQHDTGLSAEHVADGLAELVAAGLVSYDHAAEVVLDRTALRYSPLPDGDNRITGAVRMFGQVPDTSLRVEFYHLAREHSPALADRLLNAHPDLDQQAPSEPLASPSEGGSRAELGRAEVESSGADVQCAHCGTPALVGGGGSVRRLDDGQPWCGWCEPAVVP